MMVGEEKKRKKKKRRSFFIALFNPDRASSKHVLPSFNFLSLCERKEEKKKKKNCPEHHHHERTERANSVQNMFIPDRREV
jgi:hypothetical protein